MIRNKTENETATSPRRIRRPVAVGLLVVVTVILAGGYLLAGWLNKQPPGAPASAIHSGTPSKAVPLAWSRSDVEFGGTGNAPTVDHRAPDSMAAAVLGTAMPTMPRRGLQLVEGEAFGDGDTRRVRFKLAANGIPFLRSLVTATVRTSDGRMLRVSGHQLPEGAIEPAQPTVSQDAAVSKALEHAKRVHPGGDLTAAEPVLVYELGETAGAPARLCWNFMVTGVADGEQVASEYSLLARGDGSIIVSESVAYHEDRPIDVKVSVLGPVWADVNASLVRPRQLPLSGVSVFFDKKPLRVTREKVTVPTHATVLEAFLKHEGFFVTAPVGVDETKATGDVAVDEHEVNIVFPSLNVAEISQASAFYWTFRAQAFFHGWSPRALSNLRVIAYDDSLSCNGEFNPPLVPRPNAQGHEKPLPPTLKLSRPLRDANRKLLCADRAYMDTVFHEYSHAVEWAYKRSAATGRARRGFSEGFGDAMALLYTRADCYGRALSLVGSKTTRCIRPAVNDLSWRGQPSDPYVDASVYSGFVYDLTQRLMSGYGDKDRAYQIVKGLMQDSAIDAFCIPEAVEKSLIADAGASDKDYRLETPHFEEIKAAAVAKGLWSDAWMTNAKSTTCNFTPQPLSPTSDRGIVVPIRRGNTLWRISRRHQGAGVEWPRILPYDGKPLDPYRLKIGSQVIVPMVIARS